jgi:hypothetical protein
MTASNRSVDSLNVAPRDLLRIGIAATGRYTGTLFSVFVVQTLVGLVCLVGIAEILAATFAHRPLFDEGVRGDLVAIIWAVRSGASALIASAWLVAGILMLWAVASWFLVGGINAVLIAQPQGRAATAKQFGAGGAATFLSYGALAVFTAPLLLAVTFVFIACAGVAAPRLQFALTVPQMIGPLALAFIPALLLLVILWTIVDFARLDLSRYHDSHDLSALRSLFRAARYVITHPRSWIHVVVGWLLWGAIGLGYSYVVYGRTMLGTEGALALYVIRQGVQLLRLSVKFGIMAGQATLDEKRAAPLRPAVTEA